MNGRLTAPGAAAMLAALAMLAVPGCSSGGSTSGHANAVTASPSSPSSTARQTTYDSKAFVLPITVTVDSWLTSPPNPDSRNLLSWDAVNGSIDKIRFLVPVDLYRPRSSVPEGVPRDYMTYLGGLTKYGVELSNVVKTTVDGHPATLMSVTTYASEGIDGALGCPRVGADQSEGCFGIQPDFIVRIAVIPVGTTTLLAWERTDKVIPNKAYVASFEKMLQSVRFR
jgi:hypothetical protein